MPKSDFSVHIFPQFARIEKCDFRGLLKIQTSCQAQGFKGWKTGTKTIWEDYDMASHQTDINTLIRHQVGAAEILTHEEEIELVRRFKENEDMDARNAIVKAHSKLVAGWASRFSHSGVEFSDLFNDGVIALFFAANKFDPSMGNRFSTYANWWILSAMQDTVLRNTYSVKVGRSRSEKKAIRLLITAKQIQEGPLPDSVFEQIAELAETTVATVKRIDGVLISKSMSLNMKMGQDNESNEIGDMIECPESQERGTEHHVQSGQQRNIIEWALAQLKDQRAAKIIRDRRLNEEQIPLKDIGKTLNISSERVRQIERDALMELREILEQEGHDITNLLG